MSKTVHRVQIMKLVKRLFSITAISLSAALLSAPAACAVDGLQPAADMRESSLTRVGGDFIVSPSFSSHLPLLLMDIQSKNDGGFEAIISVYDKPEGNRLSDSPNYQVSVSVTETDSVFSKKDYILSFAENAKEEQILGLAGGKWALGGMAADKSLLRTYLARTVANAMGHAAQARYCEVLSKGENGECRYEGLYLLTESAINTAASEAEEFGVVEKILYSNNADTFIRYTDYIDVNSFVDYYVLNEFFMNDNDASSPSIYINHAGKLSISLAENFDKAVDNSASAVYLPEDLRFHQFFWYRRLTKNLEFNKKVIARFKELRRSILAPDNIESMAKKVSDYLYPARKRDRARWQNVYAFENVLPDYEAKESGVNFERTVMKRQMETYEQELIRIKYLLRRHSLTMADELRHLTSAEDVISSSDAFMRNTWRAVVFLLVFFSSIPAARWTIR